MPKAAAVYMDMQSAGICIVRMITELLRRFHESLPVKAV